MPLEVIYVVRHGFRLSWGVDPISGVYSASIPTPTGLPADPALTSHGVDQAHRLASHLLDIRPPIEAVYSSPFYRCLQTISPFVSLSNRDGQHGALAPTPTTTSRSPLAIRPETGLCEWFGSAPFDQPIPAPPSVLKSMFADYDDSYQPAITPPRGGESIPKLYERVASTLATIIRRCDAEGTRAVVLCTHAAVVIVVGRLLTGQVPDQPDRDDFHAFTCGLSIYRRKGTLSSLHIVAGDADHPDWEGLRSDDPKAEAKTPSSSSGNSSHASLPPLGLTVVSSTTPTPPEHVGTGNQSIATGGWLCEANSDCSFLPHGEERGWTFSGDESFPSASRTSNTSSGRSRL